MYASCWELMRRVYAGRFWSAFVALAVVLASVLGCSEFGKEYRARLYLAVQSDLAAPQDIDELRVEARVDGKVKFERSLSLLPEGDQSLPFIHAILTDEPPGAQVEVIVVGLRDDEARAFAKAVTTFPDSGQPVLELPIQWLCLDSVRQLKDGSYASACKPEDGQERTCRAGQCESPEVDVETLRPFRAKDYPGGAPDAGIEGVCFDVNACFAGSEAVVPDEACRVHLPGRDAEQSNIAIELEQEAQTGICGEDACLVPLDRDDIFGWRLATADGGADVMGQLPLAVCERLADGVAQGVRVTETCPGKRLPEPTCGPWTTFASSLGVALDDAGSPIPLAVDAAADGGVGADAMILDASTKESRLDGGVRILAPETATRIVPGAEVQLTLFGADGEDIEWSTSDPEIATIDENGLLTAHGAGVVEVRARFGEQVVVIQLEVEAESDAPDRPGLGVVLIRDDLVSLRIEPEDNILPVGVSVPLHAFATFNDGSAEEVTEAVTWSSAAPDTVAVDSAGLAKAVGVGTTLVTADYGDVGAASATFTVTSAEFIALRVEPEILSLPVGLSAPVRAEASFSDGTARDITYDVTWSSGDEGIATVSESGDVVGLTPGTATVTALFGDEHRASVLVTIRDAALGGLSVQPPALEVAAGLSRQLRVDASFSDGTSADITPSADFTAADTSVATVDARGRVTAVAPGFTTILVAYGDAETSVGVTVTDATVQALRIEPATLTLGAGLARFVKAFASYSDGSSAEVTTDVAWRSQDVRIASVGSGGEVRGVSVGATQVSVALDGVTATVQVSITDAPLVSVLIEPEEFSLPLGNQRQLRATGVFADGSAQDITMDVSWQSTAVDVLAVGPLGKVTALDVGAAEVSASLDGVTGYAQGTINDAILTSLSVEPAETNLPAGSTAQLVAWASFSDGVTLDMSAEVAWSSESSTVASIQAGGVLRALAPGQARIRALWDDLEAFSTVVVSDAVVESLSLDPSALTLPVGGEETLTLSASYSDGTTQALSDGIAWTTTDAEVATVTDGIVLAGAVGEALVRGRVGALVAEARVRVTDAILTELVVTPESAEVPLGIAVQLKAQADYSDGSSRDVTEDVTWATAAPSVAVVSPAGLAEGIVPGNADIRATLDGFQGVASLTITSAVVAGLSVTPDDTTLPLGRSQGLSAFANYSDGSTRNVTTEVAWRVQSGTSVAVKDGTVRSLALGRSEVAAELANYTATAFVTVTDALVDALRLTPSEIALPAGNTLKVALDADYSDGITRPITGGATWTTSTGEVATVTPGVVTAKAPGSAQLRVTFAGKEVTAPISVSSAVLTGIVVSPDAVTAPAGRTRAVTVEGVFSDGINRPVTVDAWRSEDTTIATVNAGVIQAKAEGSTLVIAEVSGFDASVDIVVTSPVLESVAIDAPATAVPIGRTLALTAIATYSDGHSESVDADWTSSATARATVEGGLVTGKAAGPVTITAKSGTKTASVDITISAAVLNSLQVLPAAIAIPAGGTDVLALQGTYSDGQTLPITANVVWSSGATGVVTVDAATGAIKGAAPGSTKVTATHQNRTATADITVTDAVIESITISPAAHSMPAGRSVSLKVTAQYSDGRAVDLKSGISWSSSNTAALTVSAGVATGHLPNTGVTVQATVGEHSATALIEVTAAELVSISVLPDGASVPKGKTVSLAVEATYSDGRTDTAPGNAITWRSLTPEFASVNQGVVTGVAVGNATIEAKFGGRTTTRQVQVSAAEVVGLAIEPGDVSVPVGLSVSLTATAIYSDGSRLPAAGVTWTISGTSGVAHVTAGVVTGDAVGTTEVTATSGTFADTVGVQVRQAVLSGIRVAPDRFELPLGQTVTLLANGVYSDGSSEPLPDVDWRATGGKVTVSKTGEVLGVATGGGKVIAARGDVEGEADVTVTAAVVESLSITGLPSDPLAVGLTAQLSVTARYSDGSDQVPRTGVTWSSPAPTSITVNSSGLVKAVAASATNQVRAEFGGIAATANIATTAAAVTGLSIDALTEAIPVGLSARLTARATYSDNSVVVVNPTDWKVIVNPSNASVDSTGTVFGQAKGTARVQATFKGVTAERDVAISDAVLRSISVTPTDATIFVSGSLQLTVLGVYSDSEQPVSLPPGVSVAWTSSNTDVVSVTAGKVAASAMGSATITATVAGVAPAQAAIAVVEPQPTELTVAPTSVTVDNGQSFTLTAAVKWSDGSTTSAVTWDYDTKALSQVAAGQFRADGHGATSVKASVGGLSATVGVTINPRLLGVKIEPPSQEVEVGKVVSFSAVAVFSDDSTKPLTATDVTWLLDGAGVATSTGGGSYRGDAPGKVGVYATYQGLTSNTASLTVNGPTLEGLRIVPTITQLRPGETTTLTVIAILSDKTEETVTASATFTSSGSSLRQVAEGSYQAVAEGSTTVTAGYEGKSASATFAVTNDKDARLVISPASLLLREGQTGSVSATITYAGAAPITVTSLATWSVAQPAIASIARGTVTYVEPGDTSITAAFGGQSASIPYRGSPFTALRISPSDVTLAVGGQGRFTVDALLVGSGSQDVTGQCEFVSKDDTVATVDAKGLAVGIGVGSTQVIALLDGLEAPANVVVSEGSGDAVCGNDKPERGEECDDGNTKPGDGCDERCRLEPGDGKDSVN